MNLSTALANALTGLNANARAADVVSSNLANINTEGYGRRDIELSAQSRGRAGGVRVLGITRHVNLAVLGDRRLADSALAHADSRATFLTQVQTVIGTPDEPDSLTARIAAFESSLITAVSRPDAANRLQAVAQAATTVVAGFNDISSKIQTRRMRAEADIQTAVNTLNTSLRQVQDLNTRIVDGKQRHYDVSGLLDERQAVVDRITEFVPAQAIPRDSGGIALVTKTGAMLLDSSAAELGFTRANMIAPHMQLDNGLLSGLTLNDKEVASTGRYGPISGGRLSSLFEIRDDLAVNAQTQIDALARNLSERFQDSGLDSTRAYGAPGLFTDAGAMISAADETGLAGRLTLNALVNPAAGGADWRLRDGLGATAPGPGGNASLLNAYIDVISDRRTMGSGDLGPGAASLSGHAGALSSYVARNQLAGEQAASFASSRQASLQDMLLSDGVDSDAETQHLLLIEQAYTANARMIQTLDDMMQTLLRI